MSSSNDWLFTSETRRDHSIREKARDTKMRKVAASHWNMKKHFDVKKLTSALFSQCQNVQVLIYCFNFFCSIIKPIEKGEKSIIKDQKILFGREDAFLFVNFVGVLYFFPFPLFSSINIFLMKIELIASTIGCSCANSMMIICSKLQTSPQKINPLIVL